MELLSLLEGISPWWWVAFGVTLGAVEMATMSFFLIWPAIAAVLLAIILGAKPDLSGEIQIATFAVLAVILTFAGRSLLNRYGDGGAENDTLNSRSNQMVGRHGTVASFTGPEGNVTVDGIRWRAHWAHGAKSEIGDTVEVTDADGMTLIVRPSAA